MAEDVAAATSMPHSISVVIPVYQGERTLKALLNELGPFTEAIRTRDGHLAVVAEVLLVHDNGPDDSAGVIRLLADRLPWVRPVWLSRNFGQHAATLAGMASSGGDWIITMDEDGQHDPAAIPAMLDAAMAAGADVVYAKPTNPPPHGAFRNRASRTAKALLRASAGVLNSTEFQSYRLVLGEVGRSVAAYAGSGVYLDVAISWVARGVSTTPVEVRRVDDRPSGYSLVSLISHFWRMVLTSGTRALRLVSFLGLFFAVAGVVLALYLLVAKLFWNSDAPQGWPSLMVALLLCSGAILFSLGVIAEYIGVGVDMAMGRPLYLIVTDPASGPLGRAVDRRAKPAGRSVPAAELPANPAGAGQEPADRPRRVFK